MLSAHYSFIIEKSFKPFSQIFEFKKKIIYYLCAMILQHFAQFATLFFLIFSADYVWFCWSTLTPSKDYLFIINGLFSSVIILSRVIITPIKICLLKICQQKFGNKNKTLGKLPQNKSFTLIHRMNLLTDSAIYTFDRISPSQDHPYIAAVYILQLMIQKIVSDFFHRTPGAHKNNRNSIRRW